MPIVTFFLRSFARPRVRAFLCGKYTTELDEHSWKTAECRVVEILEIPFSISESFNIANEKICGANNSCRMRSLKWKTKLLECGSSVGRRVVSGATCFTPCAGCKRCLCISKIDLRSAYRRNRGHKCVAVLSPYQRGFLLRAWKLLAKFCCLAGCELTKGMSLPPVSVYPYISVLHRWYRWQVKSTNLSHFRDIDKSGRKNRDSMLDVSSWLSQAFHLEDC